MRDSPWSAYDENLTETNEPPPPWISEPPKMPEPTNAPSEPSPYILEASAETFQRDVAEKSREVPVVLDFWAAWCQPCRMLAPLLERLAREYDGRFVLVKVDTEKLPEMAAAFGVSSIPAVFGLRDAQVIDSFTGVLSEVMIRQFLDGLMPGPAEQAASEAYKLEATDPPAAEARYREALALDDNRASARIGLARVLGAQGRGQEALAEVERLSRRGFLEPEAETVKAELMLQAAGEQAGDVPAARQALAANPTDLKLRFLMAEALASDGQFEEALELCLGLVEADRQGVGEEGRRLMLVIFQLLPPDSDLAADFRRRLSFVL